MLGSRVETTTDSKDEIGEDRAPQIRGPAYRLDRRQAEALSSNLATGSGRPPRAGTATGTPERGAAARRGTFARCVLAEYASSDTYSAGAVRPRLHVESVPDRGTEARATSEKSPGTGADANAADGPYSGLGEDALRWLEAWGQLHLKERLRLDLLQPCTLRARLGSDRTLTLLTTQPREHLRARELVDVGLP